MQSTSESLLLRLTSPESQSSSATPSTAWSRFVELYTPLIFYWSRKVGLQNQDAADLVQDVLSISFQKLPQWEYDPTKSFRGWLRTVTLNRHRELCRKKSPTTLDAAASAFANLPSREIAESTWDLNYARQLVAAAMEAMQNDFADSTWLALKELVRSGRTAAEISKEFNVSVWTLYAAKSRLLSRLRSELDGLL